MQRERTQSDALSLPATTWRGRSAAMRGSRRKITSFLAFLAKSCPDSYRDFGYWSLSRKAGYQDKSDTKKEKSSKKNSFKFFDRISSKRYHIKK